MKIVGCDYHPSFQQIAMVDTGKAVFHLQLQQKTGIVLVVLLLTRCTCSDVFFGCRRF